MVSAEYARLLDQRLGHRLPASSQAAVVQAKRRTFGTIERGAVPPPQRAFAAHAAATASEDAFHLAVGVAGGLLVVAGLGGLALRSQRESEVQAAGCPGGQLAGQPLAAADCEPAPVAAVATR